MTETNQQGIASCMISVLMAVVMCFALAFASPVQAQGTTDRLGVPGPVTFGNVNHELAWSSQPSPDYIKQEYLPAGQNPVSYADMILIETLANSGNAEAVAARMVDTLKQRKATDPIVNYAILRNEAKSELILDFLLSGQTPEGVRFIEWNAYRYANLSGDASGILLLGISRRAYGDADAQTFMKRLAALRNEDIGALAAMTLPQPVR